VSSYIIAHYLLQETVKMGFQADNRDGDGPTDPRVPETVESGSIREALPLTGEFSAGEANDEVAPNAGDGAVPAAEIPSHPLAKWRATWAGSVVVSIPLERSAWQ
jgi:hypothetical protein